MRSRCGWSSGHGTNAQSAPSQSRAHGCATPQTAQVVLGGQGAAALWHRGPCTALRDSHRAVRQRKRRRAQRRVRHGSWTEHPNARGLGLKKAEASSLKQQ